MNASIGMQVLMGAQRMKRVTLQSEQVMWLLGRQAHGPLKPRHKYLELLTATVELLLAF